jgi:hypothetical protein
MLFHVRHFLYQLGFRVQGSGFRVQGSGVQGLGFRVIHTPILLFIHTGSFVLDLYYTTTYRKFRTRKALNPQPSTLNPQPSTLNPQPSTLNPQPSTLNPQPSTLNPLPSLPPSHTRAHKHKLRAFIDKINSHPML